MPGISIVDDGIEWRHRDFGQDRYIGAGSYDWDNNDPDPSPSKFEDSHGTGDVPRSCLYESVTDVHRLSLLCVSCAQPVEVSHSEA